MFIFHFALIGSEPVTNMFQGAETKGCLRHFSAISEAGAWEEGAAFSGLCGYTEFSQSLDGLQFCCLVAAMVSIIMISVKRGKGKEKKKKKPKGHSLSVRSENVNTGQGSFFSC